MIESDSRRRRFLGGALLVGSLAATASPDGSLAPARAQSTRKTFVLVPGTFCGGWIWRRVSDGLEQAGHKVYAMTLTGLGERSHLLSREVTLDTHVADIANLLTWESLKNVCLVCWSYAGFVGAAALERAGARVSSIVWLDAFLPADGQCVADVTALGKTVQAAADKGELGFGATGSIPPVFVAERDRPFAESKVTPQPVGTLLQPVRVSGALARVARKTYVRLPKFPRPAYDKALTECRADPSWTTVEMPEVGHMAMLDEPTRLIELILAGTA